MVPDGLTRWGRNGGFTAGTGQRIWRTRVGILLVEWQRAEADITGMGSAYRWELGTICRLHKRGVLVTRNGPVQSKAGGRERELQGRSLLCLPAHGYMVTACLFAKRGEERR